ncbi:hypothetical protein [Sphingomonas sp. GB1N7]|uniref:hypothetical protein n=1 Tax=Parasphingomonas caseinilytica TaxID=3096158 RepID=UPI002FCADC53
MVIVSITRTTPSVLKDDAHETAPGRALRPELTVSCPKLSPEDRAGTLALNPTREGRRNLTHEIRLTLLREGQLGDEAMVATVLEPHSLTRAEATQARSYTPGDIVMFRKGAKGKPRPGVRTIHSAQGASETHVIAHLELFRANTVATRAAYGAISRARAHAVLYNDIRASLTEALGLRDESQVGSIDETKSGSRLAIAEAILSGSAGFEFVKSRFLLLRRSFRDDLGRRHAAFVNFRRSLSPQLEFGLEQHPHRVWSMFAWN